MIFDFVYGVFVRFSTRGVKKHQKNVLEKIHVKNFLPKTFCQQLFSCRFPPSIFFLAFLAVSLHEELKSIKMFSKNQTSQENLKKSQKKVGR
jgi:hypothetical protein